MKFGKQGGGGSGEQSLEQTEAWNRLAERFRKNGGAGVALDFVMKVVGVKTPHEVSFTKDGKKSVTAWGPGKDGVETPVGDRFKESKDKNGVPKKDKEGNPVMIAMKPGVLYTFEMADEVTYTKRGERRIIPWAGLRHYKDGTYSGNELTDTFKIGNAIYRGQVEEADEIDPRVDYLEKEIVVTLVADKEHERMTVDGSPLKGGFWWKVVGFKSVPLDDDDDDFPTPAPTRGNTSPAPTATALATAPSSSRTAVATLDDDDEEVPF